MFTSSTSPCLARLLSAIAFVVGFGAPALAADDIKVLSASALKVIVTELAEQFRKESGHTARLEFATAGAVEKRILAGETPGVFALPTCR
jgi:ABC-type molybdate transport system substrate-binding protein